MAVANPVVAFDHDEAASEHGLSVVLEDVGFSPTFALNASSHFLEKLRVCYV